MQELTIRCAGSTCPSRERTAEGVSPTTTPHVVLGETPAGALVACKLCGYEQIVAHGVAIEEAARRDAQVAARAAETMIGRTVGPLSTAPLHRLRHPDQVLAMSRAAEHATGTPEAVVLYLRSIGFELVATVPAWCSCPPEIRSPICPIHGDADGLDGGG